MVFLCGLINVIITVTKIRKLIIKAIPVSLQHAIGGGIGIFIAYIGIKNAGLIQFTSDPGTYVLDEASGTVVASSAAVPAIVTLNTPAVWLALIGLVPVSYTHLDFCRNFCKRLQKTHWILTRNSQISH